MTTGWLKLTLVAVLLFPWAGVGSSESNGGVLNGPLTDRSLGHKAANQGNRESLRLAIEHLIATYGDRYPSGESFLARLADVRMGNPTSAEFTALKREALLLENPAIDFENILMVEAKREGTRYSKNWQTRVSCDAETRPYYKDDFLLDVERLGNDSALSSAYAVRKKAERALEKKREKVERSEAFRAERSRKTRAAMILKMPEYVAFQKADSDLHDVGMKNAQYAALYRKIGSAVRCYDDALVVMSVKGEGDTRTILKPEKGTFIGDVDLHFDAGKLLFTSFRDKNEMNHDYMGYGARGLGYGVFELKIDPESGGRVGGPRVVSPDMGADSDCYDACYLPDGRIIFASTATYEGVPCVGGGAYVANLFRMNGDGGDVRRLTFDQDGNWHPSVLDNGRVMYLRWEYTDSVHYFSRVLMTMNPDGTDQKAWYGSNSYWPNSMFFARQIPGNTSMFIAAITGHHSNPKGGALCLFDVGKGRFEADGAVQFLTGRGKKVHPLVIDGLHAAYDPMFYNPYPIDDTFFLATTECGSVYLLDVFDNMVCLKKSGKESRYYEPIPLRKIVKPAVMPDRIDPLRKDATVFISDIYTGPGLRGVPRGTVKTLRVYRYEYGPRHKGGHYVMGMEAGWDAKQILGTVPVEDDGSVSFTVPADTPFAMQPLDASGRALQLMRSWTVAMPGENLSCIGCHESQNMSPPPQAATAMRRAPSVLKPFYGPVRGFGFEREVQPILDKYCVSCHDGRAPAGRYTAPRRIIGTGNDAGKTFAEAGIPDLTRPRRSYRALHPYVRRNGPEGDYHILTPLEFHSNTSELFQMLAKGHHNVKLDTESLDRLVTWADINAPYHGTWTEAGADARILERRLELREKYSGDTYDPELISVPYVKSAKPVMPSPRRVEQVDPVPANVDSYVKEETVLDLGEGIRMTCISIPTGEFSMGSNSETPMEQPVSRVTIDSPFWMGCTEVTLAQYRQFDAEHLNGVYDMHYKDQVKRGYYMNDMGFPAIRVSWEKATAFCEWLSQKTGRSVRLPTEAQWEWACRAGTLTPLNFGGLNADFSKHANLADITVKQMAVRGVNPRPIQNPDSRYDYELKDPRSNDGVLHLAKVGSYESNRWGLFDMHGNAAEWTRSNYAPYPYTDADGRNEGDNSEKVVRGGSWHDRMFRSSSSFRLGFPRWQQVYHVGFRVVIEP